MVNNLSNAIMSIHRCNNCNKKTINLVSLGLLLIIPEALNIAIFADLAENRLLFEFKIPVSQNQKLVWFHRQLVFGLCVN
jgi:hypothetical protein